MLFPRLFSCATVSPSWPDYNSVSRQFCCKHFYVHAHTFTHLCNLYSSLIGRAAREGVAKSWLISIPIQANKSAGSLTWSSTRRQKRRGGEGLRVKRMWVKPGGSEIQIWKKQVHSPHRHTHRSGHRPRTVRKSAQPKAELCALLGDCFPPSPASSPPTVGLWLSEPVLLSCGRCDPEPQVTHEAGGRSQDGSVQEAVEGEEADRRGVHPAVPASLAAHPPHQREYKQNKYVYTLIISIGTEKLLP